MSVISILVERVNRRATRESHEHDFAFPAGVALNAAYRVFLVFKPHRAVDTDFSVPSP
jgi:hypothetical protein